MGVKAKIIESLACIYLFGTLIVNDLLLADVISESKEFQENEEAQEEFAILRIQRIFPIICAGALFGVSMLRSLRYRRLTCGILLLCRDTHCTLYRPAARLPAAAT